MANSTLNTTAPFIKDQLQTWDKSCGFTAGQMQSHDGSVCDAIVADVTCIIEAGGAVTALTATERRKVLEGMHVFLKMKTHDTGATLEPFVGRKLADVNDDAARYLGHSVDFSNATDGLARAYVLGNNTVKFRAYIPTGHVNKFEESPKFTGLDPVQLLGTELDLTRIEDPFNAAKGTLTLKSAKVLFTPGGKLAEERRIFVPVNVRRVTAGEDATVKTPEGLVLEVSQVGPLAGNTLGTLTVKCNGKTVAADPATAATIYADYLAKSGTLPADEADLTARRTPVFLQSFGPLTRFRVGAVEVTQKDKQINWDVTCVYIPLLSHQQVMDLIQGYAATMKDATQILVVNTAQYEGLEVADALIPYCGFTVFTERDAGFLEYPGVFCRKGGVPTVHIPDDRRDMAAARVAHAMRPGQERFPTGNRGKVRNIVLDECRWIPGTVISTEGYRKVSPNRQDAAAIIRDAAALLNPALAAAFGN